MYFRYNLLLCLLTVSISASDKKTTKKRGKEAPVVVATVAAASKIAPQAKQYLSGRGAGCMNGFLVQSPVRTTDKSEEPCSPMWDGP